MASTADTLWLFALASKYEHFTTLTNLVCSVLFITVFWMLINLLYWSHPGGPAWGRHSWTHFSGWAKNPIPGPRGLPIVGSMGLKMGLAHRKIAAMANQYGSKAKRLMAFSLGETRMVVTCNPEVAKEILNSPVFSDRPDQESAYGLMFNRSIGFAPYGTYWRTLRKIASTHMFSPKQIKVYETQRREILTQVVESILSQPGPFQVRDMLRWASLSNMMGSVFGRKYALGCGTNKEVEELKEMVDEGYELLGVLDMGDHLPWLAEFDFQKVRSRCSQLVPKVNRFVGQIIDEHRSGSVQTMNRDFVDVLLNLRGDERLSHSDMVAVLWEMIFRGTDATAVLMEWILARLTIHKDIQSMVHNELDQVVGPSRAVDESDLSSLPYLTAVIKEVLRVHPPGPLMSWSRLSIEDTTVDGCHVAKGTTAIVNMWAIARDPVIWVNPDRFDPDRFLNGSESEFNVLGSDLRLAPFGSGRRSCPGKVLGLTTVTFWVASLLHEFEWVTTPVNADVDLSEVLKLSCEMAHPLTVDVRPRRR